jgi:hypothetical protein
MAASTPEERAAVAQAHLAQAEQLTGPLPAALGRAYLDLQQLWHTGGFRALGPAATLGELLTVAPPELAARVRERLAAAGVDPDALAWPPVVGPGPWPGG